ncbi:MAG: radical SAM protein [Deltaproteobacteria bacterium]|nr:radical SAM protein [Candidatus Zymogenaceae bacterium]
MKILLLYPHLRDVFHKLGFLLPPLGLGYLAAVAKREGHDVEVRDLNLADTNCTPRLSSYDAVGISLDTSRYNGAIAIARAAMSEGTTVIMGGPHATFVAEDILKNGDAHYVVRGEGEETFVQLLNRLSGAGDIGDIGGVSFNKRGTVIHNPDRPPPRDLDALQFPDRDILQINRYKKLRLGGRFITSMVTSRGCPFNCGFCSSTVFSGTTWRNRSASNVVEEVELIVKDHGFGAVCFMDDNFTMDPRRVIEIAEGFMARHLDIYWWCFSRGDIITKNEEMVRYMAESGCRYVFMGIESAHDTILEDYGKKMISNDCVRAIQMLKDYGVETMGSFIIGWPGETRRTVKDTIRASKRIGLGGAQFSILTPYPGTEIYDRYRDRIFERDWEKFDCFHSVMSLDYLKPSDIQRMLKRAFFSFYFTPKRILSALTSPVRGRGVGFSTIKRIWEFFAGK